MKNIKSYNEYTELNEGLFDALKNVFKFFKGVNQKLQTSMGNFTKKLQNSKDWNNTLSILNSDVIEPNTKYFEDSLKNASNISQIRKINYEVHSATFTELNAIYVQWDKANTESPLLPVNIFKGTPFATMYTSPDPKKMLTTEEFVKNLPAAVNAMVKGWVTKSGYPMTEFDQSLKEYTNFTLDPPSGSTTTTPPTQNPNANASYIMSFDKFSKLNEADVTPTTNTNQQQTNQQQTNQQQTNQTNQNNELTKLKTENTNSIKNNYYGTIQNKLKAFKPTQQPGVSGTTAVDDKSTQTITSKMTASGPNVKSKDNLLNTIFNDKTTVDQLNKTRDAIAPIFNIDKPDEKIGKF